MNSETRIRRQAADLLGRLFVVGLVILPFVWINQTLHISRFWTAAAVVAALAAALPAAWWPAGAVWQRRGFWLGLLAVLPPLLAWGVTGRHPGLAGGYVLTVLLLLALTRVWAAPGGWVNIGLAAFGVSFSLLLANIGAGVVLAALESPAPTQPPPTVAPATAPATATAGPPPTATAPPPPTATPDPALTATPSPTPAPTRPIAGFGFLDWQVDNGEADWTHLTGFGPRINSTAHAYMYDADGNIVYDTIVAYNGKGYRGPEASYEKPDDVYRVLVIGDSFVEAIQVDYAATFYAQLQAAVDELAADKRVEIVAMGRTGWGTMHETTYYQVEGYKYNADLVILSFFINDVADNFPRFFYPGINNTNFEFVVDEAGQVQILDTNETPAPPNRARQLYNALPGRLQATNLARLIVRLGDPPVPVMTPGGVMTRVHPQFYIYVAEPAVEGYPEAWARTEQLLGILADEVQADGAELAIMPIFIGQEMILNVSGWFAEDTAGWQWDPDLPDERLADIAAAIGADLVRTRPVYEAGAAAAGGEVFNLLFLPEDGHFNEFGHDLTTEVLLRYLQEKGVVR